MGLFALPSDRVREFDRRAGGERLRSCGGTFVRRRAGGFRFLLAARGGWGWLRRGTRCWSVSLAASFVLLYRLCGRLLGRGLFFAGGLAFIIIIRSAKEFREKTHRTSRCGATEHGLARSFRNDQADSIFRAWGDKLDESTNCGGPVRRWSYVAAVDNGRSRRPKRRGWVSSCACILGGCEDVAGERVARSAERELG